ncbi:TerB family tellurite resistance protein [uncultured Thalassolituus sp.]|uniref:tellurite resistance TerB family protein n=1 Tax=Thalassolituus sp. TaxID=2030822 RepID=UPI00260AAB39|nr:TerB family tellurite resistance protein [uncultured Thalassolituus sp.]
MIRQFLERLMAPAEAPRPAPDVNLAAAVLLIEVMKSDHDIAPVEQEALSSAITELTGMTTTEAAGLVADAMTQSAAANDLFRFTEAIHASWSDKEKSQLLISLWRVAYADNNLDKYEEHLIRRISDLLYVPHSEFIRTKLIARDQ